MNLQEEENNNTEATAEVYLLSSECNFNAILTRREATKYTEAIAKVYLPPSESTLQQGQRCTWLGQGVLELKLHKQ